MENNFSFNINKVKKSNEINCSCYKSINANNINNNTTNNTYINKEINNNLGLNINNQTNIQKKISFFPEPL